ncbi:MAG: hypothetical protein M3Q48_08350 [Actinomycetota bacterium]|nr:hypothetical protein [Actinomycetota bacterium]
MYLRHYRLSGNPMPTGATSVETRLFGDSDSRQGDLLGLASGGLVAAWHQQGATGPDGQFVAYRAPGGDSWAELPALAFMPTMASDQVLAQHPSDGSVWLLSNPDAWGAIGAVHLSEVDGALRVDWTDGLFITQQRYGSNGPDPEDPVLAAAADAATGSIAHAYQSAERQRFFKADRTETASRVAVVHVATDASLKFLPRAPVWAERVSTIGLVVAGGEAWVSYRPVDPSTLSFADAYVIRHSDAGWEAPHRLGTLDELTNNVTYASGTPSFSTRLTDGRTHLWTL